MISNYDTADQKIFSCDEQQPGGIQLYDLHGNQHLSLKFICSSRFDGRLLRIFVYLAAFYYLEAMNKWIKIGAVGYLLWIGLLLFEAFPFVEFLGWMTFVVVTMVLIYWAVDRFIQKRKVRELSKTSLQAEVHSLKTQINPHFFFNTLNNLYGLTVEKSEVAPKVILKLSDMLRYTIYGGEKETVPIKDEISYLENFIELNKIRYHKKVEIKFEKFLEDGDRAIPPLLFINLLENAFKHGVESLSEDAFVYIKLVTLDDNVRFEVENNFEPVDNQQGGIGLKNLKRRLELLLPGKHTLESGPNGENIYKALLKFEMK